jgi:hypothetical protein
VPSPDGDRPAPPPRPSNPPDGPPKLRAVDDPVKLRRAGAILRNALARNGMTIADLKAPDVEHVKAA